MSIPKLEQCCCGCSLRTGTKIIGWLSLIGTILQLITSLTFILASYKIQDDPSYDKEIRELIPGPHTLQHTVFDAAQNPQEIRNNGIKWGVHTRAVSAAAAKTRGEVESPT